MLLAVKRAGLQPAMLVATLMSHVNHGPYDSGKTLQTKGEICGQWIQDMTPNEWEELQELIALDRCTTFGRPRDSNPS